MTYCLSHYLQRAVYGQLVGSAELTGLIGTDVYDAPLPRDGGIAPDEYVTLGPEDVRDRPSVSAEGALHDFVVIVHSNSDGFLKAKQVAGAVCDVLVDADLTLERGQLIYLRFLRAKAEAGRSPEKRRIVLKFRAFLEDAAA